MKTRATFPECCATCEYLCKADIGCFCSLNEKIRMDSIEDLILVVCGNYSIGWDIQNTYRNRQGLPSLPTNYYPYGPLSDEAKILLKKAFDNLKEDEELCLKNQLEIFIEAQRS
jgi:hypothetical protein